MKTFISTICLILFFFSCAPSQDHSGTHDPRLVGGRCEGCEAVLEYGSRKLGPTDTLPGYHKEGQKIKISGTIFQADGVSPAPDVILYIYHTNSKGVYPTIGGEKDWARRHGYIRGWVKTDDQGNYTFYTSKPGSYPNTGNPAHIHPTILEPNGKYYWLEDYYFEGDPFLTSRQLSPKAPRGGTLGVLKLSQEGELWVGNRDFILGKNVPQYE